MTVKELREFLNRVDEDFNVIIVTTKPIPIKELSSEYPYTHYRCRLEPCEGDIGYSSKTISIDIDLDKCLD